MNKLVVSLEALRDLESIRHYIADELKNRPSAERIVRNVIKDLRVLEQHVEAGPSVAALTGYSTDLRILVCGKYIALYMAEKGTVYVSRILNAKQDYLRVLFGDNENKPIES